MSKQGGAKKAYRAEENWSTTNVSIVWANTAEEAKRKVKQPWTAEEGDRMVLEQSAYPQPKGITIRRAPSEDRP